MRRVLQCRSEGRFKLHSVSYVPDEIPQGKKNTRPISLHLLSLLASFFLSSLIIYLHLCLSAFLPDTTLTSIIFLSNVKGSHLMPLLYSEIKRT